MSSRLLCKDVLQFIFKSRKPLYLGTENCQLLTSYLYKNRPVCSSAFCCSSKGLPVLLSAEFPLVNLRRFYARESNAVSSKAIGWRKRLWTIIRGIFLITGGVVWIVALFGYLSLEKVSVDVLEERGGSGLNALERKLMNHFYKEKDEAGILKKDDALDRVWRKLNQEEQIKEIFGYPVYICGYNYSNKIDGLFDQLEDSVDKSLLSKGVEFKEEKLEGNTDRKSVRWENEEEEKIWEAGCYIEGSKKVGLLTIKFEEHKKEWVPVALHLETLEKSGHVVSNVSGSLPNGIKNFTRLSN